MFSKGDTKRSRSERKASNQISPQPISSLMSLCVLGLIPCFSSYGSLLEHSKHHEGSKFQRQNTKGPTNEAFSEFLSI